ncbi:MAG TPA: choice-of-anchor J domain-containing protein [Candidatus Prevotella avicola]|uniref:Choice-of-anchor J domain-containing protein n=1 Tax=Candidatus Prevotella avicola TaxID=2838738 RepID=A0A9D2FYP8_9BACT|nr:choice-of-anchor J domain-containing protein [Candidatus Prevotella avicola]
MKRLRYIIMVMVATLMASCMGSDYAAPGLDPDNAPWGNNEITETNVVSIADLKARYASTIASNGYVKIEEDMQIKGVVTGNDYAGNIYQQIPVQDETGALVVGVSASALHGFLPEGQEILIDLKDLYIGGYGEQCQIGSVYTSPNTGKTGIGRMDRYTWQKHFRLIGEADVAKADALAEDFDPSKMTDASYMEANAGKLMTIRRVSFLNADGKSVFAPDDGSVALTSNCANRALREYSSKNIVVRTSTYADFAQEIIPEGTKDIKGIFTRYYDTWQILLRSTDDITDSQTAALEGLFDSQGDFVVEDKQLPEELNYIWTWSGSYGMKASAFLNNTNYASESWLISPVIDLSQLTSATLTFQQAGNFFSDMQADCSVLVSTDRQDWTPLTVEGWPEGSSWTFYDSTADLSAYAGQSQVYIAFRYTSSDMKAGTWEVRNVVVE